MAQILKTKDKYSIKSLQLEKAVGLYVHIPFCKSKCNYCDFASFAGSSYNTQRKYLKALKQQLSFYSGRVVKTIFIGGGTPSSLYLGAIKSILNFVKANYKVLPNAEISIECNPCSITKEKLIEYKDAGINRISIGVQSFVDSDLKFLGRSHSKQQATSAIKLVQKHFTNINIDVIYGINNKTENIKETMNQLIKFNLPHVSAYSLITEPGTPLAKYNVPNDEIVLQQHNLIKSILKKAGLVRYEVSNYAKQGFECQHNNIYWSCTDYVGVGLAAHSYLDNYRFESEKTIKNYLASPCRQVNKCVITAQDKITEQIMLGLRTSRGIKKELVKNKPMQIEELKTNGFIKLQKDRVIATQKGLDVLNAIILKLS